MTLSFEKSTLKAGNTHLHIILANPQVKHFSDYYVCIQHYNPFINSAELI
jgi:hypothetical protein